MARTIIFLATLFCAVPLQATVYRSSALGWSAGQDITSGFKSLADDDTRNAIVLTTTDAQHRDTGVPLLSPPSAYSPADYCIQGITIRNCTVTHTTGHPGNVRFLLSKQAHTIDAENITKIGDVENDAFASGNLPRWNLPELGLNYDVHTDSEGPAAGGVNIVYSQAAPPAAPPSTVPFLYGPNANAVPYQFSEQTKE